MSTQETQRLVFNFNLDDEVELDYVVKEYGILQGCRGVRLARKLAWQGKGVVRAANGVANYCWNKLVAMKLRREGKIEAAMQYEAICERIYTQDLQPRVDVW